MNLLFDLGHPAHFHLFKHLIREMMEKQHRVIITIKDQPVLIALLRDAGFEYINLGRKGRTLPEKAGRQLVFGYKIWNIAKKYDIDIGVGVSVSVPQAGKFCRMKTVVFDDDDYIVTPLFYQCAHRFADCVVSPDCLAFQEGGKKYTYYNGYHELAYLHPNRFSPDQSILAKTGLNLDERYFILRFNAFKAYHDSRHSGFTEQQKEILLSNLLPYGKVFITGETDVSPAFQPYVVQVHPAEMHSFLAFATMFIGDSQTMASEAAVLGVPSIRMNSFAGKISYLEEQEKKYGLTYAFLPDNFDKFLTKITELLSMENLKAEWGERRDRMLKDKTDVTDFYINYINNMIF